MYPYAQPPVGSPHLYPGAGQPSEDSFNLRNPARREARPAVEQLPEPRRVEPEP